MKLTAGILATLLLAVVLLVYISKPTIPQVSGMPDYHAGAPCLYHVPEKYEAQFFTYKGWLKAWYAATAAKWGIEVGPGLRNYYQRYVQLQIDVNCYIRTANDRTLNMALSPTEFMAVYNVIAKNHDLPKLY